jgi:hypothetical protein
MDKPEKDGLFCEKNLWTHKKRNSRASIAENKDEDISDSCVVFEWPS